MQGRRLANRYLRRLREAVLAERKNMLGQGEEKKAKKHSEVFELSMEEAQNKLEDLELKGRIRKLKVANGCFWEPAE